MKILTINLYISSFLSFFLWWNWETYKARCIKNIRWFK